MNNTYDDEADMVFATLQGPDAVSALRLKRLLAGFNITLERVNPQVNTAATAALKAQLHMAFSRK